MSAWNPFKKAPPENAVPTNAASIAPDAAALLDEIVRVRDDTLGQDLRPMQRLLRDAEFLLPLHEAPRQTPQGLSLRYMTLEDDSVMVAFTDAPRLRDFFAGENPLGGTQMAVNFSTGQSLCQMATNAALRKIIINPNSDILFALPPMIYEVLAQGLVIGHISDEEIHSPEIMLTKCPARLPEGELLEDFRAVLREFGIAEAYWLAMVLPPDEMRFCIGITDSENLNEVSNHLVQQWIGKWPLPTPLHILPLGRENSPRDGAIRAGESLL